MKLVAFLRLHIFLTALIVAILYYFTGRLGQLVALQPGLVTPVWPPAGIALAAVILFGMKISPGIFLGSFFNNYFLAFMDGESPGHSLHILASVAIAIGATLQACLGGYFIRRTIKSDSLIDSVYHVLEFFAVILLTGIVSPFIGTSVLLLSGQIMPDMAMQTAWTWWMGDLMGTMIFTPLIISWLKNPFIIDSLGKLFEIISLILVLAFILYLIFYTGLPLFHFLIIIIIWAAFRFPYAGTLTIAAFIDLLVVWTTAKKLGPYYSSDLNASLLSLDSFIAILTFLTLIMIAFLEEKSRNEKTLRRQKQSLEMTVSKKESDIKVKEEEVGEIKRQLYSSEKLAFTGQISSTVAFELKNPLHFLSDLLEKNSEIIQKINSEITINQTKIPPSLFASMNQQIYLININRDKMSECVKRIETTLQKYFMLTKSAKTNILKTNINELLNECLQLVSLDEEWSGINITKDFDPALGDAEIDPQDMLRVFFNIFKNANQAFKNKSIKYPADFIPELGIKTKDRGHYIDIFIRDNGEGIPKDNIDKMFIPFFTTWPSGKGIGLGLPLAREIILNHGGAINISSVEDEYTEITINLPKRHLN